MIDNKVDPKPDVISVYVPDWDRDTAESSRRTDRVR